MSEQKLKVIIVDDEEGMCKLLKEIVQELGYKVKTSTSPIKALNVLEQENFDIAIIDIKMPEMNGIELLQKSMEINKNMDVIMITAYGSIESAVEAIKLGAFNYISKPFQSEEIRLAIHKIVERKQLISENIRLKMELNGMHNKNTIIGQSQKIKEIIKFANKIANSKFSVLITGESGTGKEIIAKYIHEKSDRKSTPFITVQCNLIQKNLLESELFGHKKGAFTGAIADRQGLFEEANNGTIFLDEIGDIDPDVQGKLLRFLQDHEIRRVGDTKSKILDVRFISATNKNLEKLIEDNVFRDDLYFRLKVITIQMPALRERIEDIPILAAHFLEEINKESKKHIEIERECFRYLMAYHWPGNVRELKNCIESASTICENNIIQVSDIMNLLSLNKLKLPTNIHSFKESKEHIINEFERNFIINMLIKHKGNITASAKDSKMDKKNFWDLMKKHNISHNDYK